MNEGDSRVIIGKLKPRTEQNDEPNGWIGTMGLDGLSSWKRLW
jgi:hypothetical protein